MVNCKIHFDFRHKHRAVFEEVERIVTPGTNLASTRPDYLGCLAICAWLLLKPEYPTWTLQVRRWLEYLRTASLPSQGQNLSEGYTTKISSRLQNKDVQKSTPFYYSICHLRSSRRPAKWCISLDLYGVPARCNAIQYTLIFIQYLLLFIFAQKNGQANRP